MKPSILIAFGAAAVQAAYTGDIVQYWVEQSSLLVNGTIIGGLPSPPSAWFTAIVQGAIYAAAVDSSSKSHAFQQLAVSHAAHDALISVFHGARLWNPIDAALRAVIGPIGIVADSHDGRKAAKIGRNAAARVAKKRADDGLNHFVNYVFGPTAPGVYQQTPGGAAFPDTPQAVYVRPFGGVENITRFRAPPPPSVKDPKYEEQLILVKELGELNSTKRTVHQTDSAYIWRESSVTGWNRFAHAVVKNSLAGDVLKSAKFYAQLNYALANAGFASWDTKYAYNAWRPVTAIQRTDIWLATGRNVSSPGWTPLLRPTPSHQDYVSTHSTFGGAAAAIIRAFNHGDVINVTFSSNVTLDSRGVITRTYTNLSAAALENSKSRLYGGIHFDYAGQTGINVGNAVALETLQLFDKHWDKF